MKRVRGSEEGWIEKVKRRFINRRRSEGGGGGGAPTWEEEEMNQRSEMKTVRKNKH